MRKLSYLSIFVLLCGLTACTENMIYRDAAVKAPGGMLSPTNGYFLELRAGSESTTTFSWLPGACEDGLPVQYEIAFFDKASDGKEITRLDAGVSTQLVVTHKTLNNILGSAGISAGGTGTVYWIPVASRGIIQEAAPVAPFKLDVKRLLGFDFIPEKLYLTGTGTEGGTDPALAIPFRVLAEGEYELYTQFSAGEYLIVDDPVNPQHTYGIQGALAVETDTPITTPANSVFRIRLDFNVKSAVVDEISQLRFWICHRNTNVATASYLGLGKWVININLNNYGVDDYGKGDNRYQFRATMPGVAGGFECWGPTNSGEDSPPSTLTSTEYFFLQPYPASMTDQWGPKFKFHNTTYKQTVNIYVDMGAEIPTHYFEIL